MAHYRPYHEMTPVDRLLSDILIRIQLSHADYHKAVHRYETIEQWIDRPGSLLRGLVELFYPQGSMAIGTTIAARGTDEFDLDAVAQLKLPQAVLPSVALDLLYDAIRGDAGSPYYTTAKRRTRCITVEYQDGMHIDVTPMILRYGYPERESWIFHDRHGAPDEASMRLIANPYGFAEWFKERPSADVLFANLHTARALEYERMLAAARSEPIPDQEPPAAKSMATIVVQILKRWRNVQYEPRSGRRPPSIVIAKLVADQACQVNGLLEETAVQARNMHNLFQETHDRGGLIMVSNPVCEQDVLTDRWPSSLDEQEKFLEDLDGLVQSLQILRDGCDLGNMKTIMKELFGEDPTERVFTDYNQIIGSTVQAGSRHIPKNGSLAIPSRKNNGVEAVTSVAAGTATTRKHTFYGR